MEPPPGQATQGQTTPAAERPAQPANPGVVTEKAHPQGRFRSARSTLGQDIARYKLAVIPDLPPSVNLKEAKAESANVDRQTPGGIRLTYELADDYGIAKADLIIEQATAPLSRTPRTLFSAPPHHPAAAPRCRPKPRCPRRITLGR